MSEPSNIDMKRIERVKIMIKEKRMSQAQFARSIGMSPENLSRIINRHVNFTETTAELIISYYPEYNLEWLLGYSDNMKKEDLKREYVRNIDSMNNALVAVLEGALREVCARENLDFSEELSKFGTNEPLWIWESVLLQDQLRDFAIGLVWNYVKYRDNASLWNSLDTIIENISRK